MRALVRTQTCLRGCSGGREGKRGAMRGQGGRRPGSDGVRGQSCGRWKGSRCCRDLSTAHEARLTDAGYQSAAPRGIVARSGPIPGVVRQKLLLNCLPGECVLPLLFIFVRAIILLFTCITSTVSAVLDRRSRVKIRGGSRQVQVGRPAGTTI